MKAQDFKDIKTSNVDTIKVMANNEVWWGGIDDTTGSPGSKRLKGGNLKAGFYGEVPAKDLITGDELARLIGLTAGTSQNSNEPWLKFSYLGKTEFIAKKTFRNSISWDDINAVNAVFGNRTIDIGGKTYKIRLLKGKTEGKQNDINLYEGAINHGSEWNKLMLPIHKNAPSNWVYKGNVNSPTENWNVGYTGADLFTHYSAGKGSYSWCQENGQGTYYRLLRGGIGVSCSIKSASSSYNAHFGWRPVLELV